MSTVSHSFNYFGQDISALCSKIPTPVVMTGLFRDILARQFADENNLRESRIRHLIWNDTDRTGILIESIHRWKPETTEKKAAIIIKRNAYRNIRLSIAEGYHGLRQDTEGNSSYITAWSGTHTLFCFGKHGAEAELLSAEVQQGLTEFAPALIKSLPRMHRLQVVEAGPVSEIEEASETFVVPVTVSYQYEQVWTLRQQAPRLMHISTDLIYDC